MIKKSDEKKMKTIESKFYLEALGSENFSIGDYGLDRKRLGRALGKILRKSGTWFNTSDRYCFMITNHLEELGLIKATADKFVVVNNWRDIVQEMFPKENISGTKETKEEEEEKEVPATVEEVVAPQPQVPVVAPIISRREIKVGDLKNTYEFCEALLERIGEDFKTQGELRNIITELYRENFGEDPNSQFFFNRLYYLQSKKILESIEDEGVVKHLRSENYKEILEAQKGFLKRSPFKFKENHEVTTPIKEEVVEAPVEKQEEAPKVETKVICVCINPVDLTKLYNTEVIYNDGHRCVIMLDLIQANLDVLKNIEAESDLDSQDLLWDEFAEQRKFYLAELAKIDRLCGKEA